MALTCFLRGAASKIHVCPLQALTKQSTKLSSGAVPLTRGSPLFSTLARSHIERKPVTLGLARLRANQIQNFSVSPKSYSAGSHSHSTLWSIERALSAALVVLVPAALAAPNKLLDSLTAVALVMHSHWGLEALVVDYVRPIVVGNVLPKVSMAALYAVSILTLAGLFHLIYNDVGLARTVRQIWSL